MRYLVSYCTDKGIKKNTNQDALLIKSIRTAKGGIALFCVCDGMGGLQQGEVASSTLISELKKWFDGELTNIINEENEEIVESLNKKIIKVNSEIIRYSQTKGIQLGTTVTAFLVIHDIYYIIQIGDSRAYKIDSDLELLTIDQTFVQREVDRGNITAEEAKVHSKKNILLQCVGVNTNINPKITSGEMDKDTIYMLCSDGLHHKLSERELKEKFSPSINNSKEIMDKNCKEIVELVKERKEVDNITIILFRKREN